MNYQETLDFLFSQLPMFQRDGNVAFKKDLKNTLELCEILKNPQHNFKSVHVAGTNGKGSTSHMLAAAFQEAGYKTGLYTSPHLKDFRERIRINGTVISEEKVIEFVANYFEKFKSIKPSFFEWTVALAFHHFSEEKVDIAIIETGLGGRLDSTNIINPELSIITNIGMDHTDLLGDSLDKIAFEKAGVIKKDTPVVIGNHSGQKEVFESIAISKNASIYFAEKLTTNISLKSDLKGYYQSENISTVFQSWLILRKLGWLISFPQLQKGLKKVSKTTGLRGRYEILKNSPLTIADTAHNKEGLQLVIQQLLEENYRQIHLVLGFVKDKKWTEVLPLFPKNGIYYFCQASIPRALDAKTLKIEAQKFGLEGNSFPSVEAAFKAAQANAKNDDLIYIGGSTFVVAEII